MRKLLQSKLFWVITVPVVLVGLYALLGFKVAPNILREQAQAFVRENYGRELSVGEVRLQPFKLQAEIRDLLLPDTDGRPMLGFERLFVDFELASLWNRAYTFREVTIEGPLANAVVRPDGSLNLGDLALPDDPDEPDEPLPAVWIQQLDVLQGTLGFTDLARTRPFSRSFRLEGFELRDFRTTPAGGDFQLSARSPQDETFEWQGRFALEPVISSEGEFSIGALQAPSVLDFLGDARPFTSTTGLINLAGSYRLVLAEPLELDVTIPTIDLEDLSLLARGADEPWIRIPSIALSGITAAMPANRVEVAKVAVDSLTAQAWMDADGSINLEKAFSDPAPVRAPDAPATATQGQVETPPDGTGPSAAAAPAQPTAPATEPQATEQPWTVGVGSIEVTNAAIDFEDRAIAPGTRFRIAPVNMAVSGASLDLSQPLPVTLDATINDHAQFSAQGRLTPDPLAADFEIELARARMTILQPYVLPLADLSITAGELGVVGRAQLAPPERDGPELSFDGSVTINGFKSVDNALRQDLVNFSRLELQKLQYEMAPDALRIDRVLLKHPYARVIISPEQVINIAAVLDPQGTAAALAERRAAAAAEEARSPAERRRLEKEQAAAEKTAAKARKTAPQAPPPPTAAPPDTLPIRIGEVRIDGGRMNFSDLFIQPNFSADVRDLGGKITGLSSAYESRASVDLDGKLEQFSPVEIKGELQPFAFDHYTDMALRFENIDLPIFNPYSGPFAGYNIAKGKLTTDLHYRIEDRRLDAQHQIRIDQLEWGEATAEKGEATLPVKFATSLLKDRDGVINLDVPVGGTLDDPTFRIGPIVWQIIRNIIVKAVTAPFALLGSLFEGAEDAQFVDFAPGEAELDAATAQRLGALASSLAEKPELRLDVPIGAVPDVDRPALAERAYAAAVDQAITTVFAKQIQMSGSAPAFESLEPKQQIEVLAAVVREQSGAEPVVPEPPVPPEGTSRADAKALRQAAKLEFLERTARAGVVVPEAGFGELAEARADAIERALLEGGSLDPTRVFRVREGKVTTNDGKVRFELGLQ